MEKSIRTMTQALLFLLSALLLGMDGPPREKGERRQLEGRQAQLAVRIKALKQEQDFLLFQKSFLSSDSKYLVLDLAAGTGTLKYRNRTLRIFRVETTSSLRKGLRAGRYILTAKTDGPLKKRALVFQHAFVIHGKGYAGALSAEKKLPGMLIGRRDLAALYYAVDSGTMLYIR